TKVTVSADRTFDIELPTLRLAGTVNDATTGKPLEGASVSLDPDGRPAGGGGGGMMLMRNQSTTDATGAYHFDGVADGTFTLSARKDGYAVQTRAVRIVPDVEPDAIVFDLSRSTGLSFRATDARSGIPLTRLAALVLGPESGDPLVAPPGAVLYQGQL